MYNGVMLIAVNGRYENLTPICIYDGKFYFADIDPNNWDGIFESPNGFYYRNGDVWLTINASRSKIEKRTKIIGQMIEMYQEFWDWKLVFECMKV